jgi:hypothetical protein
VHEFAKFLCAAMTVVGGFASAVFWWTDMPSVPPETVDFYRFGVPGFCVTAFGGYLLLRYRRDRVPDYLRATIPQPFRRGGVSFGIVPVVRDAVYTLELGFQSERDWPCVATIALRPVRKLFGPAAHLDRITVTVEIPPAGFGVTRIPLAVPKSLWGKTIEYEIGATVRYPVGRGRRVRFRGGVGVHTTAGFWVPVKIALIVVTSLLTCGMMFLPLLVVLGPGFLSSRLAFELPRVALPELDDDQRKPTTAILWQLGDPPL